MSVFARELAQINPDPRDRRWLFVPYDQLSDAIGPLSREDPKTLGIVLVEAPWKAARRPYHKQKLALILSNLRHFALEQARRGVAVRHVTTTGSYRTALEPLAKELGLLSVMAPAERELRHDLKPLADSRLLEIVPHEGWLTSPEQFDAVEKAGPHWRMDAFYRRVRKETGILMSSGKPEGGKFSFDTSNRQPWRGEPSAPSPPRFRGNPVTDEVGQLIADSFAHHPGKLDLTALPSTKDDAETVWTWAQEQCLEFFGPYEDAMSVRSQGLFHTRISALMNIHRLLPSRVVSDVARMDLPIESKEGFVRQVLGWREFVAHVHRSTDGFRTRIKGYSHHITRLMILANIATLLDVTPRELTDWFWIAYTDAYDWVVEPNVLGMGTFAVGTLMTTKPYVSGAGYIHRMSDYCSACAFDPRTNCPITNLYWAFLGRHKRIFSDNPRLTLPLKALEKRDQARKGRDRAIFEKLRENLTRGEPVHPADLEQL
ncbi:MAG: cryptochrome/photolyase family protein [Deltaproteobacteria bacterium]